jgi:hypothetical protein
MVTGMDPSSEPATEGPGQQSPTGNLMLGGRSAQDIYSTGFAQALGLWLLAGAVGRLVQALIGLAQTPLPYCVAVLVAFGGANLLGRRHRRRGRPQTAAGLTAGSLTWPLIFIAAATVLAGVLGSTATPL